MVEMLFALAIAAVRSNQLSNSVSRCRISAGVLTLIGIVVLDAFALLKSEDFRFFAFVVEVTSSVSKIHFSVFPDTRRTTAEGLESSSSNPDANE